MISTRILITGATGYIGGSVLATILESKDPEIQAAAISALVRKEQDAALLREKGVNAIIFRSLGNTALLREAATENDIVINCANSYHPKAAEAFISGLADRKKATGTDTHLIQTSGTSNLGDHPTTGTLTESRIFSDKEDIYQYERGGCEYQTYILMSPTIYGIGSGFFKQTSIQIDALIEAAYRDGAASVIGSGAGEWDHVHISDLALFYELLLSRLLAGEELPSNKHGVFFNETGHQSWREVSERIAKAGFALGYLKTDQINEISLAEAAEKLGGAVRPEAYELGMASRSRTRADLARELGWKPTKTRYDFEKSFDEEREALAKAWQN